jgi:hypothetical protein
LSEAWGRETNRGSEYTVVGVIDDGTELNQAVASLRELGVTGEDLTVVLKRQDPDEPEPFPEGTRYIVVPDDSRGLVIPISFAAIFAVAALLFAFTAPGIGTLVFVFFIALATILAAGAFIKVGADPILMEMEVPAEDAELWNEEFEKGRVLVFASTTDPQALRPMWETLRGLEAGFYVVERRLVPQPVSGALLRWAGAEADEGRVVGAQEA